MSFDRQIVYPGLPRPMECYSALKNKQSSHEETQSKVQSLLLS